MKNLIALCVCIVCMSFIPVLYTDTPVNGSYDYYLSTVIHFIFFRLLLGFGDK